jgi:hypothetical protein
MQACSQDEPSPVLAWQPERRLFEPAAALKGVPCATGLAGAVLGGASYLLVTGDRNASGQYEGPFSGVWRVQPGSRVGRPRRRAG